MSVLIKGMEMPRDCDECRFSEVIDGLGCIVTHYLILRRHGQDKPSWCPLVEVPPHGRLIDADAVLSQYNGFIQTAQCDYAEGLRDAAEDIKTAPTIIEAEEGEKKMKVVRVIPCICSPNWEEKHIESGYYGMPQLRVYGGSDRYFDAYCPKCGRGGLLQYKSAYLALKGWNEMQEDLRRNLVVEEGEDHE